jgi:integrase
MEVNMGSIYKRGNTYWIKYYKNGKNYRESSGSDKKMVAQKKLAKREGEIADGKMPGIQFEKVSFDQLAEDFLREYKINQKKSLNRAERSVNHLKESFEGDRVVDITTPRINTYILKRIEEGAKNATINRELSALKRMLNLGAEQTPPLVDRVPHIPMLKENNVRKGFFEHDQFLALRDHLPEYLRGFVTFAYKTGWRVSEISELTWQQVDREQGIVRIEAGESKNDEARTVYMDEELKEIVKQQWEARKKAKKLLPYVFLNRKSKEKIKRFDKAWNTACDDAKIGNRLFHDLRRTAIRNMIRSGIPERVAMMISGHKTRSVFDRYNIVNDADLKLAAEKHQKYLDSRAGTISGTVVDIKRKKGQRHDL